MQKKINLIHNYRDEGYHTCINHVKTRFEIWKDGVNDFAQKSISLTKGAPEQDMPHMVAAALLHINLCQMDAQSRDRNEHVLVRHFSSTRTYRTHDNNIRDDV